MPKLYGGRVQDALGTREHLDELPPRAGQK